MNWDLIVPVGSLIIAAVGAGWGFWRGMKVDAVSERSGVAAQAGAGIAQVQAALENLIDTLQEDNASFRDDLRHLTIRLDACNLERDTLRKELSRMQRKYGENGPEVTT